MRRFRFPAGAEFLPPGAKAGGEGGGCGEGTGDTETRRGGRGGGGGGGTGYSNTACRYLQATAAGVPDGAAPANKPAGCATCRNWRRAGVSQRRGAAAVTVAHPRLQDAAGGLSILFMQISDYLLVPARRQRKARRSSNVGPPAPRHGGVGGTCRHGAAARGAPLVICQSLSRGAAVVSRPPVAPRLPPPSAPLSSGENNTACRAAPPSRRNGSFQAAAASRCLRINPGIARRCRCRRRRRPWRCLTIAAGS
ncbi:SKI family transcriptional corepressor 1-like [Schistocerca americana]|uniref:SKI family transcriptional corepressor 1-like n=1 Tax=Schistocerca americana TaxID=7009 RepID=UPI001F4FA312|nr:SKI family transcriptional corepressor 1-like [Schistocerca americana]